MACPYFFPIARFDDHAWAVAPRMPLGDLHTGECRALATAITPGELTLRQVCNNGYGRDRCDRFPRDGDADAVRFHVTLHQGTSLRIQYIVEKGCWPLRHGSLEYCDGLKTRVDQAENPNLERQAVAFAESYLRRT